MNSGTKNGIDHLNRNPKKLGISTPDDSAIDLTMKFGAFPIYWTVWFVCALWGLLLWILGALICLIVLCSVTVFALVYLFLAHFFYQIF